MIWGLLLFLFMLLSIYLFLIEDRTWLKVLWLLLAVWDAYQLCWVLL